MEFQFRYRFEAAHRFLNSASVPCMTPHGHTWHTSLHLKSKKIGLNPDNMVMEFSKAKSSWKKFVGDVLDHSYLCNHKDPLIEPLLSANKDSRLLRFPGDPTTEIIALFFFSKAEQMLIAAGLQNDFYIHGITVEETPTNSIFCDKVFYSEVIGNYKNFSGWWSTPEIDNRSFSETPAN